ncbi:hypothetical protein FB451DRAFT_1569394 [Mycena latifolia]|nr:hypothetical protein FB451DRAFT_1569394 [Mycena latifolia]
MPLFNNCTGVNIHDGHFYEVAGDVIMQTQQQLTAGNSQARSGNSAAALQQLPGPAQIGPTSGPQDGGTERCGHEFSGVMRSVRRISAVAEPYGASSRPRLRQRGSSNLSGNPAAIASNSGITTWRPDSRSPSVDPHNAQHSNTLADQQYSTREARENYPLLFPPDGIHYSLSEVGPSLEVPQYRPHSWGGESRPNRRLAPHLEHFQSDPAPSTSAGGAGTFITAQNIVHNHGDTGIHILHRAVALEALHDSADSYPQPKCHPETRGKMLEDLWAYATDPRPRERILWLYGPAGAGKSAIMWSLCERLEKAGLLGGTFFFKRGHLTRGNAKALFSTIAYRLALRIPQLRNLISRAVETDPSVVAGTPEIQLQRLILEPCQSLENQDTPIIIIDGLDECEERQMQQRLLCILRDAFAQHKRSIRILIASRPEAHISDVTLGAYQAFNVEQSFADVRKYLLDEFGRICGDHWRTMTNIPRPWPSKGEIESLVRMSSGHFIYAATVIKFIDDPNFRPPERLAVILGTQDEPDCDAPFAALDQLYVQILNSAPRKTAVPNILRVIAHFGGQFSSYQIDQLLELQSGDTFLALRGLHSLVNFSTEVTDPNGYDLIEFQHASFGDFLRNPTRSGHFYIGQVAPCLDFARSIFKVLSYKNNDRQMNQLPMSEPRSHIAWRMFCFWIRFLVTIPPSAQLVPLIRLINPVFIFSGNRLCWVEEFIAWLRKIDPVPADLIGDWEDYLFMDEFSYLARTTGWDQSPTLSTKKCEKALSKSPWLLHFFYANEVLSRMSESFRLYPLHTILNISWEEIRSTLCSLRDIMGKDNNKVQTLARFIWDKVHRYDGATERTRIALQCIQVLKGVNSGQIPVDYWSGCSPANWGLSIRLNPSCPQLLQDIRDFTPPFTLPYLGHGGHLDPIDFHNILQWLKMFPEPPWEMIHQWEESFMKIYDSTNQSTLCEGGDIPRPLYPRLKEEIEEQNTKYSFNDSFDCIPHLMRLFPEERETIEIEPTVINGHLALTMVISRQHPKLRAERLLQAM